MRKIRPNRALAQLFSLVLVTSFYVPAAVAGDGEQWGLSAVTFGPATIDLETGYGTVPISITCLSPSPYVRARVWFEQEGAQSSESHSLTRAASSFDTIVWFGCDAGEMLRGNVVFGGQDGRFIQGPAMVSGVVESFSQPMSDLSDIGPTTILLHAADR